MLADLFKRKGQMLVTAESCTGGMIATAITDYSGSSSWFERGFVTYSNLAKQQCLNVSQDIIEKYGAVSEQVAKLMAEGALANSDADVAIATTGIAGPDGGSEHKPVGTVCFGYASNSGISKSETILFKGDRASIRQQATNHALTTLTVIVW